MASLTKTLSRYKTAGIDSMCFIYHLEGNKTYGRLVKQLFLLLQKGNIAATTSVLTLAEILAFERLQKDKILFEETKQRLLATPNLTIMPVDTTISEAASIIKYQYGLTLPDAIQLATALLSSQEVFISNDRRFKKIREIEILLLDDFL